MVSTLGALIREARERAGFTQADLARKAGTSRPAIARYEAGRASPRVETAQRCIEACGIELRIELVRTSPEIVAGGSDCRPANSAGTGVSNGRRHDSAAQTPGQQRRATADAALARSVEDRLRTNDAFTRLAAELRRG